MKAFPRKPREVHTFYFQCLGGSFIRKTNLTGSQIKGAAAPYGLAFGWSASDLPLATTLFPIFDQFRIREVHVRIAASRNQNTTGSGAILYVVDDFDNSNLLTSVAGAQGYESCRAIHGSDDGDGEGLYIKLKPSIPIPSLAGNVITVNEQWEDCAVLTNVHYGLKLWYQTVAATDPQWDVDAMFVIDLVHVQ